MDRVLTLRILAAGPAILLLIALRTGGPMGSPMEGLSMEMMWLIVLVTFILCQIGVNRLESTKDHGWARQQALRRAQPLQASNDAEFWSKATAPSLNGPGSTGERAKVPTRLVEDGYEVGEDRKVEVHLLHSGTDQSTTGDATLSNTSIRTSPMDRFLDAIISRFGSRDPMAARAVARASRKTPSRHASLVPPAGGLMMTPMERPESSLAFEIHSMSDEGWIDISMDGRGQVKD